MTEEGFEPMPFVAVCAHGKDECLRRAETANKHLSTTIAIESVSLIARWIVFWLDTSILQVLVVLCFIIGRGTKMFQKHFSETFISKIPTGCYLNDSNEI